LLSRVATLVCLMAAGVTALPEGKRLIAISLLILFHFGGICTAVVFVAPPNAPPPWLANQILLASHASSLRRRFSPSTR
jgi:hypothetical protein